MHEFIADEQGERLDAFVARVAEMSRARAARLIEAGMVLVDGVSAAKSFRLETGARVLVQPEPPRQPPEAEAVDLRVVYEDDALMVISKPAGLVVHPAPGHESGTVVNALLSRGARGGEPERPGIVHRLDAGTSGLMIVARSDDAYGRLVEMMSAREISRVYLALVEGSPKTDTMTIDAPIGRSPKHRQKMAVVAGGKDARTEIAVVERLALCTLVEARPYTGRTHQIRVHLSVAGHGVLGDPVYGTGGKLARALGLARPFLHAARLTFIHPISGESLALQDPLPPELAEVLERARAG